MHHLGMIAPKTPKKLSLRDQIRQLTQINAMYERGNAQQAEAMDKMAENMTHLILRIEAMREKFGISVDAVNELADAYLAKMSANQEMQAASALHINELKINGVTYRPASPPEVAPLQPPSIPTVTEFAPISPAPPDSPPAHCASDGERIEFQP